jgi:hypothetical protein
MQRQADSRAELAERCAGTTLPVQQASVAALADEWEEQTRSLHFIFRDLGSEAGCFGWSSPFEVERCAGATRPAREAPDGAQRTNARVSARHERADTQARIMPFGAVRV